MASRPPHSDPGAIVALLSGPGRSDLAQYLVRQRWFAAKTRGIGALAMRDWATLDEDVPLVLLLLDVDGDRYHVPVTVAPAAAPASTMAEPRRRRGRRRARRSALRPAGARRDRGGRRLDGRAGRFAFRPTPGFPFPPDLDALPARRHAGEQSNTSVILGGGLVLKTLRRPQPGLNPDLEITRFLTTRTRSVTSRAWPAGSSTRVPTGSPTSRCSRSSWPTAATGWKHVLTTLRERSRPGPGASPPTR